MPGSTSRASCSPGWDWRATREGSQLPAASVNNQAAAGVPPPAPGSMRYFVLLYTPAPRRRALATLLAVADELGSGLQRRLDHGIAHLRLEWWREEAVRDAGGTPTHPWLIALRAEGEPALPLRALAEAAVLDLASATLGGDGARQLPQACLLGAARLLCAGGLTADDAARLVQLGTWIDALDAVGPGSGAQTLPRAPAVPTPALQPALAPLLVWGALARVLAGRRLRRGCGGSGTMSPSAWDGMADNFTAWRAARRALHGRFSFEADPAHE